MEEKREDIIQNADAEQEDAELTVEGMTEEEAEGVIIENFLN